MPKSILHTRTKINFLKHKSNHVIPLPYKSSVFFCHLNYSSNSTLEPPIAFCLLPLKLYSFSPLFSVSPIHWYFSFLSKLKLFPTSGPLHILFYSLRIFLLLFYLLFSWLVTPQPSNCSLNEHSTFSKM